MQDQDDAYLSIHKRVIELLEQGRVVYSRHADERQATRGLTTIDIEYVIRAGRMIGIRISPEHAGPSYTIKGLSLDGDQVVCAVAIDGDCLVVVTAHPAR